MKLLDSIKKVDKKWKEYALAGCVIVLFYLVISNLGLLGHGIASFFRVTKTVVLGFVLAYIVNPLAVLFSNSVFKGIKKERLKWILSIVLTVIAVLLILSVLIAALIPQVVGSAKTLAENFPTYVQKLKEFVSSVAIFNATGLSNVVNDYLNAGIVDKVGEFIKNNTAVLIATTTSIGSSAMNGFIGAIVAIYFLLAKKNIQSGFANCFKLMLSPLRFERLRILMAKFNAIFSKYIVCELIDSAIVLVANYIFMLICRMPNAVFVSVVVGVANLAPTFGPIVGAVMGAFILLLVQPGSVIPFLIFTVILQTLDGYVIKPKLFGDALNVPGVIILVAIIVFSKLMGVTGMLLSIPFAAILTYIYAEIFIPWLELRKDLQAFKKEQSEQSTEVEVE